jgi:Phage integrase family
LRLVPRYDIDEKVWTTPMPFLLQRTIGAVRRVMSPGTVTLRLKRACREIAEGHAEFVTVNTTVHDFRRLFATDLVNNSVPIPIGAALLGHLDIQTTRGYVAIFEENVVQHYQLRHANRRTERPRAEYRPVTDDELTESEAYFDKRKVELGSCGRPYGGTPRKHEHACIRCPMLHINPKAIPRLNEQFEADLEGQRERAVAEGWLGEIEGNELTLRFLRDSKHVNRDRGA